MTALHDPLTRRRETWVPAAGHRSVARWLRRRDSDRSLDIGRSHDGVDMPPWNRLGRLARLATLPETRGLIVATARSTTPRTIARRVAELRAAPLRDLANPASARRLARRAVTHPAVAELASAGLLFLPGRYMPLGWAATWATRRLLRRYREPPVEAPGATPMVAGPPPTVATEGSEAEHEREGPR